MKKALMISALLCLFETTAQAADRDWSNAEWVNNLDKGHFGSQFHFEFERFRGPHLPEVVAKAVLKFGLLNRWQMNLELNDDFVFYANSIALTNQLELMRPEDSVYDMKITAFLRYKFQTDMHHEYSGKIVVNRGFWNDHLLMGGNLFMEAATTVDRTYGASLNTMAHIFPSWGIGSEEQVRLSVAEVKPDVLVGVVTHINVKTSPIPIYYMYKGQRVWQTNKSIHAVEADIRFMKGVTGLAPNWLFSIGISLAL